jgi:predicted MPP superfamily phosphohydrolase
MPHNLISGVLMEDRVLILGDLHCEFVSKEALDWVFNVVIPEKKPNIIVQCGDLYDFYSFSRFPRSHNITTPNMEILNGRACAEEIWRITKKKAPKAKCYQLLGNHCDRPKLRLVEKFPELESLLSIDHLWQFPGVETIHDSKQELILEINKEVMFFMHGYRSKLGDHAKYNLYSTIVGHSHRGGVVYSTIYDHSLKNEKTIFELNVGFLGDAKSRVMDYRSQKLSSWTLGVGFIDKFGPQFIRFR